MPPDARARRTLRATLAITFLASLGTGVFWNGLSFIAKHAYDFPQGRTLALYATMGIVYAATAASSGRLVRGLARRLSPRGVLAWVVALQAAAFPLPVFVPGEAMLWAAALAVTVLSALMWPVVESFLGSGLHGPDMRRAVSLFNLTWMPAVALPLLGMAPIIRHHAEWSLAGTGACVGLALAFVPMLPAAPRPHDEGSAAVHVGASYPRLLRSARLLLPVSYVLMAALSPIVPYRLTEVGVEAEWETPATVTWMVARVAVVAWLLARPGWHGRWTPLGLATLGLLTGFGLVAAGPGIAAMLAGFALFGAGLGVIYAAALYYALAVHRAGVEAGGTHEALIGLGYGAGPMLALGGLALGGGPAIALVVTGAAVAGASAAVPPWLRDRREGRERGRSAGADRRDGSSDPAS